MNYTRYACDEIKIDKHTAKYDFEYKDYNSGISEKHLSDIVKMINMKLEYLKNNPYYYKIRIS